MRVRKTTFLKEKLLLWLFLITATGFAQTVASVSPSVVTHRSSVTIIGTGFTTSSTVRFYTTSDNSATAGTTLYKLATSVTYVSATEIRAILPDVLAANTASTPLSFRVFNGALYSAPQAYTYVAPFNYVSTSGITEVVTNWNNGSTTYWKSTSASSTASQQPDGSHSVMGFRYGGKLYSTGNETTITSVLSAAGYTTAGTTGTGTGYITGNFRALPIKNIQGTVPNSGPNLIVLASKIDGSATTQVPTAPNVAGLSVRDVLIDGTRGLNLGTGVANLPAASVLTFEATNIVADGVADGVPDIIVSQVAEPTDGSFSVYSFTDANGNIVGHPVQVAFSASGVPVIGRYKSDFFTLPVGQPLNTAQINGSLLIGANTRDIRMVGYKIGDFGISTSNAAAAKLFKVMPSGTSDPAFMAYNRNRFFIPAPEITGQPASQSLCPGGTATFTVTVAANSSGTETPVYQWEKNGVPVSNGNGITGATTATLTINPVSAANAGAYRCLITNASGAALSNTAYLNTIITAGPDVTTCVGTAVSVEVSSLGNTPTYQWYSNTTNSNSGGTLLAGQTSYIYNPSVTTAGTYYYYAKSRPGNLSCAEADVYSDPIKVTVVSGATGGVVSPDQSVCPGGYAVIEVSNYSGTIQWQSSSTNTGESSWSDITSTTTSTYNTPTLYAGNITATTYYRAKLTATCGNAISPVSKVTVNDEYTWTGNVNTDWTNPGNWTCNTVPSGTTTVIIPAAPVNQPHVLPNTVTARAKTITVEDGASVTVNTAGRLRVTDNIIVAATATFLVENNASLVQVNSVANIGNITVKRNSNALYRLDYTLWSSPVIGQTFSAFSPATITNRFYEYRYGADAINANGAFVEQYWAVPASSSFVAGRGFLIRMPDVVPGLAGYDNIAATYTFPGSFTGQPINGDVQPALTLGAANDNQANHFYAVGNPYPSPISVYDFFTDTDNAARIKAGSALYFWRKKNNSTVSSYATLTLSGYTANAGTPGFGGDGNAQFYPSNTDANPANNQSWIISPGQGFLVRLAAGVTQNVVFKNSMRRAATVASATPAGQPFFKTNESSSPSRYWLNLTDATGIYSQALVAYSQEGTLGVDYGYDGLELAQGTVRLYSKQADNNFTIQARPDFTATDAVAVGYTVSAAGQYTINLDHMDGVFEGSQDIYLKDNQLGTIYDLKSGGYVFTTDAGTFGNRFEVVYVTNTLDVTSPEFALNNVLVYKANGSSTINITSGSLDMSHVTVYDIRGRQIYSKEVSGTQASIADLNIANQVIIVEVTTTAGKVSKKVIF